MPRVKPITNWGQRPELTTDYTKRPTIWYILLEDGNYLLLENGGKFLLEESPYAEWQTPRKWTFIQDLNEFYITDLQWEQVDWLTWEDWNLISTRWI